MLKTYLTISSIFTVSNALLMSNTTVIVLADGCFRLKHVAIVVLMLYNNVSVE